MKGMIERTMLDLSVHFPDPADIQGFEYEDD